MKNQEYVLLFVISFVVFYTILGLLGPFAGLPSSTTIMGSVNNLANTGTTTCSGNLQLAFFPDPASVGNHVSAILSGIQNCNDKVIFVRQQVGTNLVLKCSCVVATGNGCGCSFTADSSICVNRNFYAQIDMNGNGDYNNAGETTSSSMNIQNCRAP